ncbi:MAG: hypothetical protein J6V80_05845 [Clostridia bacterium]|nr:hypothetical protein [Clostridia bacterium]
MEKKDIRVDFTKKCGRIKPLHCINGGPRSGGYNLPVDFSDEFSAMGVPLVRTAGSAGEYGLNQYVNIHCIFPDFTADENLEQSYNFLPTDLYLASIRNTGAGIFFRLGESREPYSKKLYACPPIDPYKWARICEHIVMHYNEGWAGGFKLGIKYWEIWSAPDTAECWSGTKQEYFELYRVTANHLRERFPKIKIGAYGARGFYSLNRLDASEEMKSYVPFMQEFFSYITKPQTAAPLDFFTWACYTTSPEEIALHAQYARTHLDGAGLRRTRSFICEYNTVDIGGIPPALRESTPSELGAALIMAQKSVADMMMYSSSDIYSRDNALFSMDDHSTSHHYASYSVMCYFAKLYKLGTAVESGNDQRKELYSLAATDGNEGAMMLVTRNYEGKVEIAVNSDNFNTCVISKTVSGGVRGKGSNLRSKEIGISSGRLTLSVGQGEIYLLTFFNK